MMVVVDEATSLLQAEPVPKGLPKDSPLLAEIGERNMLRADRAQPDEQDPPRTRFAGVSLVLASQVASSTVGIPTELRANLPGEGAARSEADREQPPARPRQPRPGADGAPYIADAPGGTARGVGVFEFEGKTPGVFKGFFNRRRTWPSWLLVTGTAHLRRPDPDAAQLAKNVPTLAPDGADDQPAAATTAGQGERAPSGRPAAAVRAEMGDDWDIDPETGKKLSGYEKANRARQLSAQMARESN